MINFNPASPVYDQIAIARLEPAPLRRVACVLQFAPILLIGDPSGLHIAGFQNEIRGKYPSFRSDKLHEVEIRAEDGLITSTPTLSSQPTWHFADPESGWNVTLTKQSLAIEVDGGRYSGRAEFIDRFAELVSALHKLFDPIRVTRLGFRYMNLFDGESLDRLGEVVRAELLGIAVPDSSPGFVSSYTQTEFASDSTTLLVKYGYLKNGTQTEFMPSPLTQTSWMLDIDAWRTSDLSGGEADLKEAGVALTDIICSFFRWSMANGIYQKSVCNE